MRLFCASLALMLFASASYGDGRANAMPAKGNVRIVPVTRDNWFSSVKSEADGNNGGAARLKFKSYQELSVVDIDPTTLEGYEIVAATLHLRAAGNEALKRVSVSTISADWVEGTSSGYKPQNGSSSFRFRQFPDLPWTNDGGDLCSVILGQGNSIWRMADASPPEAQGWQTVPVDPKVVAARIAGVSHGFLVFDDTGSEWRRDGDKFIPNTFPNRLYHSRESGKASAPYFTITLGPRDEQPPARIEQIETLNNGLSAGELLLRWETPTDVGAGVIGFVVLIDGRLAPRYMIPVPGKTGERVTMRLRDLGLLPGKKIKVTVFAVDGAGNKGEATTVEALVSRVTPVKLPDEVKIPEHEAGELPRLGANEIAIIDELDKVHPKTGEMIPKQPPNYLAGNHLWNAKSKTIRLHGGRNEFIAFQILARGKATDMQPTLTFASAPAITTAFGDYKLVETRRGVLPDPIVSLKSLNSSKVDEETTSRSFHAELYVPHGTPAGYYQGKLLLKNEKGELELPVELYVWDFTLPDSLSFLCEMNGYGLPAPERGYYRQAHRHRTSIDIVPYHQSGKVHPGWAPAWDGKRFDWAVWDARFASYFDGSAFADLPRKSMPLEIFYLPLHENWPTPVEGNYLGGYWADTAFPKSYRDAFVEASRQYAEHLNRKGWRNTLFQCFLNNKLDFKKKGWSRTSTLWLLDEPANFQDFWALRYYGAAFHEGAEQARGPAKMLFRANISRPMWQRDSLDGILDYSVVGGAMRSYHRMVIDRKEANGQIVIEYGNSNAVEDSNMQPLGWCLDSWSLGMDGVLPWLAIGDKKGWEQGEATCLFYPPPDGETEPVPSIRLKAYRRGQQDVEYLTLWTKASGASRSAVGEQIRAVLKLAATREETGFTGGEDAGVISYKQLLPQDAWALRMRLGEAISRARPAYQSKLVNFQTPERDVHKLEGRMVGQ